MDISGCTELASRCRAVSEEIEKGALYEIDQRTNDAVRIIQRSFCGSFIGYHANVYYLDFQAPPPGDHFSPEWGFEDAFSNPTTVNWREVSFESVEAEFQRLTEGLNDNLLKLRSKEVVRQFKQEQQKLVSLLNLALEKTQSGSIEELRDKARNLKPEYSVDEVVRAKVPQGGYRSRDSLAVSQGLQTPPHVLLSSQYAALKSTFFQMGELATVAETASNILRQKSSKVKSGLLAGGTVFIGHGRNEDWRELGIFIQDRLGLKWDEFNREPSAGITIKERLENMLEQANFAFLIMTAEDEHADNTVHARENVIHEIGLFQGRLGFNRAIILLEGDCQEFSNIHGIGQIRYPKGYIKAVFEDVRGVLEREGILVANA